MQLAWLNCTAIATVLSISPYISCGALCRLADTRHGCTAVRTLLIRARNHGGNPLQEDEAEAGRRLQDAITEAFGKPGLVRNPNQLSTQSGVARSVIDGWGKGRQPTPANMRRVAEALGVTAESLWLRWLGYDTPEPGLGRIAQEISELRDVISAASRRAADAERRDWELEPDRGPPTGGEPSGGPDKRPT